MTGKETDTQGVKGTRSHSTEYQSQGHELWMVFQAVFFHTSMLPLLYQTPINDQTPKLCPLSESLEIPAKLYMKKAKLMVFLLP